MLYAIIILSILVVDTSFVYWSIALWNEKQQKDSRWNTWK